MNKIAGMVSRWDYVLTGWARSSDPSIVGILKRILYVLYLGVASLLVLATIIFIGLPGLAIVFVCEGLMWATTPIKWIITGRGWN